MLKESKAASQGTLAAVTGSVTGSCPWPGHAFGVAGKFPDDRVPDGWPCLCGQMVAKWKKCNLGHEHLEAESPNDELKNAAPKALDCKEDAQ